MITFKIPTAQEMVNKKIKRIYYFNPKITVVFSTLLSAAIAKLIFVISSLIPVLAHAIP